MSNDPINHLCRIGRGEGVMIRLKGMPAMDQVQTISIAAILLASMLGGGGLVSVNNQTSENAEELVTLTEATNQLESRLNSSGIQNTKPLIFVNNLFLDSTGSDGNGSLVASVVDFDGYVERFGIDHDLDGQIDVELFDESNFIYSKSYDIGLLSARNSPYQDGLVYIDACIARIVVIAIDNQGGTSYNALQVSTNEDPHAECNPRD